LRNYHGHVIDQVPTILELAGVSNNNQQGVPFPGRSLKSTFTEDTDSQRNIWWYHEGNRAMRVGDWKIVAASEEEWELFRLDKDRTESNNLAGDNPGKGPGAGKAVAEYIG